MAYLFQRGETDVKPYFPVVGDVLDFPRIFGKITEVGKSRSFADMTAIDVVIHNFIMDPPEGGPATLDNSNSNVTLVLTSLGDGKWRLNAKLNQ